MVIEGMLEDIRKLEEKHPEYRVTLAQIIYSGNSLSVKTYYLENSERLIRFLKTVDGFAYQGYETRVDDTVYRYDNEGNLQHSYTIHTFRDGLSLIQDKVVRDDGNIYYYRAQHAIPKESQEKLNQFGDHILGWAYKDGCYSIYVKESLWEKM